MILSTHMATAFAAPLAARSLTTFSPTMSESGAAAVEETPPPKPTRSAEWNPNGLTVPAVPEPVALFSQQFMADYLKVSPTYLDGSLAGDIGFDPWALTVLANPPLSGNALQALDKKSRTAEERNAQMLAMSAE